MEDVSKKLRKAALPGQSPEIADFGVGKEPSAKSVASLDSTIRQAPEKINPQKAAPEAKKRRPT